MRGTIFIHANAGHALRHGCVTLRSSDVLDCMGGFHAGDRVHVVVRGGDGGQGVIATGIARCDADALRQARSRSIEARDPPMENDDRGIVMDAQDMELLWPSSQLDHP